MGYYTSYSLSIEADKGYELDEERFQVALLEATKHADGHYDSEVKDLINTGVWGKLYDIVDTITEIAVNFPHLLIMLSGDGEDSDDLWEQRWKGSEKEYQIFTIPPFQNPNLKTEYEKKNDC